MADEENEQSPWTRPGFIASAIVIGLIVVIGVIVTVITLNQDRADPEPTSTSTPSTAPSPEPTGDAGGASVCGLGGVELSGRLTSAPTAEWAYQGTVAYPTSGEFGPGATDDSGFRYCFQHSPEGALFAASNAVALGTDPAVAPTWIEYFAAEGPYRDELLAETATSSSSAGTRLRVAGFRLLSYDGNTARVDLAGEGSTSTGSIYFSAVYELVWQDGDWKANTDTPTSFDFATIPNLTGYIAWGE